MIARRGTRLGGQGSEHGTINALLMMTRTAIENRNMNKQPNSEMCFVCGRNNPVGLHMRFHDDGESKVASEFTVPDHYQGYPGIVHGGVLAAMLDEVVARVSMIGDPHHFMISVKLAVLYRHPVQGGQNHIGQLQNHPRHHQVGNGNLDHVPFVQLLEERLHLSKSYRTNADKHPADCSRHTYC